MIDLGLSPIFSILAFLIPNMVAIAFFGIRKMVQDADPMVMLSDGCRIRLYRNEEGRICDPRTHRPI